MKAMTEEEISDSKAELLRGIDLEAPHYHAAGHLVGEPSDTCARCGRDFRDPIHHRQ